MPTNIVSAAPITVSNSIVTSVGSNNEVQPNNTWIINPTTAELVADCSHNEGATMLVRQDGDDAFAVFGFGRGARTAGVLGITNNATGVALKAEVLTSGGTAFQIVNHSGKVASFNFGGSDHRNFIVPNKSGTLALIEDFAAPPAIGGTTPAAGAFTSLTMGATDRLVAGNRAAWRSTSNEAWEARNNADTGRADVFCKSLVCIEPLYLPWYNLNMLPDPDLFLEHLIIVRNATGGPAMCYADGFDWRRITNNAVVS